MNNLTDDDVKRISAAAMERLREKFLAEERQRIVDAVFAVARENDWCSEVLTALEVAYPTYEGEWRTSDGFDVYGFDAEDYDRKGFNRDGWDREGYNYDGYNHEGVNRKGEPRPEGMPGSVWCYRCQQYH